MSITARIITASDSAARGQAADTAGPAVADRLREVLNATVENPMVIADDISAIDYALDRAIRAGVSLVLTVGGTGCAPRDVTPEATAARIERPVPGLTECMRAASARTVPTAWLSRAVAGIAGSTLIVNLPGSRTAAVENLDAILPILPHALAQIAGEGRHPEADAQR